MKKIISIILMFTFIIANISGYKYQNLEATSIPKTRVQPNTKLSLVTGINKDNVKDEIFDNLHKSIKDI